MSVVTRFAPSPTGQLHLGNARTALFNFLHARRSGGRFLLRIEDTDALRSTAQFAAALLEDLQWLGLSWDEEPCHQSTRMPLYQMQIERLEAGGHAYPCFCSAAMLEAERHAQIRAGRPPRYSGRCRDLPREEAAARRAAGEQAALRFRVPAGRRIAFQDLVHGPQVFLSDDIGDFVLLRADRSPAFFFSNAIDDALMGVTAVLRGEDHLANTPRQLLILESLGLPAPQYGHLSMLLSPGGAVLSKREGATSLGALREQGYLPAALRNLLFRLGHYSALQELLDPQAMASAFDLAHLQRAAAHFDPQQLQFWQKEAVHRLSATQFAEWLGALLPAGLPPAQTQRLVDAIRPNVVLPGDARAWIDVVLGPPPDVAAAHQPLIATAGIAFFAAAAQAAREHGNDYARIVEAARTASGRKGAELFRPLRLALTGAAEGPELKALLAAMPDRAAYERLQRFA